MHYSLSNAVSSAPTLKRSVGLTQLIFYGVGTMVGAGFYALIGRVAGLAGMSAPIALGFSGLMAFVSAASFAELSSRFPVSAGEVRYVEEGFRIRALAVAVGWLVIVTGVVSAATLSVATIGFLQAIVRTPDMLSIALLVIGIGAIAAWGIDESVVLVFAITLLETGALACVALLAGDSLATLPARWPELLPDANAARWVGVFSGSFLAFYAFIGFEDMVNIAEEVDDPRRALPIALLVGVAVTTILYVAFSLVAVLAVPPGELAASASPVSLLVSDYGAAATTAVGLVSIAAGINGALVQVVMASRVAYGMARRDQAPRWFGIVHPTTRTPLLGTVLITIAVALLAIAFPLTLLAQTTSAVILAVFALVNLSLWRVKRVDPDLQGRGPRLPLWLPWVGAWACVAVLLFQGWMVLSGE